MVSTSKCIEANVTPQVRTTVADNKNRRPSDAREMERTIAGKVRQEHQSHTGGVPRARSIVERTVGLNSTPILSAS